MRPEFWQERWRTAQIGFHQAHVDQFLKMHWRHLGIDSHSRVFVPLSGKSLDLLWLRDCGHRVVGVELSEIAVQSFCMENGIPARRRAGPNFDIYEAPDLELLCGDFFALDAETLGSISAVYDRASLISWTEELREPYARHMAALTPPGTQTLLLTVEYPQEQMAGPPFSIPAAEVARLYADRYRMDELSRHDILGDEPRLRSRGLTELRQVCYRLTRL